MLDYINVEQLGEREEDIDERVVENEIVHNIKNFIMTFGRCYLQVKSRTTERSSAGRGGDEETLVISIIKRNSDSFSRITEYGQF